MSTLLTLPDNRVHPLSVRARALVSDDPKSEAVLRMVERVAPTDASLLVIGETGTGKELVARHLHEHSGRQGPFVAVNCGAFNEALIESELFGYEAGAFTGAQKARQGWFEAARGGTLFLDEIGDLPLSQQVKLLRVLQERQVTRVGSRQPIPIDVRLVAATNVDLREAVDAGHFRRDLWYRLNVVTVELPPLSERPADIIPLAQHFIRTYCLKLGLPAAHLCADARDALMSYPWPGNIRELENVMHYAVIVASNADIRAKDLRFPAASGRRTAGTNAAMAHVQLPAAGGQPDELELRQLFTRLIQENKADLFDHIESTLINTAYEFCHQNQVHTARVLGITRNILRTHLIKRQVLPPRGGHAEAAHVHGSGVGPFNHTV